MHGVHDFQAKHVSHEIRATDILKMFPSPVIDCNLEPVLPDAVHCASSSGNVVLEIDSPLFGLN